jgi:hypothetical protein
MARLTKKLLRLIAPLLLAGRLCQAACIPEDPKHLATNHPNQDALALLLKAQDRCPDNAMDFRNLVEGSGARLETTMVNFESFRDPNDGAFFLFEIVSGQLGGLNPSIERGDLLFGHFLASDGSHLTSNTDGLLVEAIAWDPAKQLFNFYELVKDSKLRRASWFFRGDSSFILDDIQLLYRQRTAGQQPFQGLLRCSGCHVNGGLIQKELAAPHNDWWRKARPLPLGDLTPDAAIAKILQGLVDADELAKVIQATSRRLSASPQYRKALQSRTMQEQLRPLFCAVEVNIESDNDPVDAHKPTVQIPAGFFADPRLGAVSVAIPRDNYQQALDQAHSKMPDPPGGADADHAWLAPVKANSDIIQTDALVEMGVIDSEFVADVLAVDFTNPLISAPRCGLLKLVPAEGGPDFLVHFEAALKDNTQAAAKQLLDNLTDPKHDANFHRQQVAAYLEACQKRASKPEAATEWVSLLAQRRADVDRAELSKHPNDQKILEVGRVVFPSASAPEGNVGLTPDCEVRPQ